MSEFINDLGIAIRKLGVRQPIGGLWVSIDDSIPKGGLRFDGKVYSKALYKDLFDKISKSGKLVDDKTWIEFSKQIDDVPYYANVDDQYFRLPKISKIKIKDNVELTIGIYAFGIIEDLGSYDFAKTIEQLRELSDQLIDKIRDCNHINVYGDRGLLSGYAIAKHHDTNVDNITINANSEDNILIDVGDRVTNIEFVKDPNRLVVATKMIIINPKSDLSVLSITGQDLRWANNSTPPKLGKIDEQLILKAIFANSKVVLYVIDNQGDF